MNSQPPSDALPPVMTTAPHTAVNRIAPTMCAVWQRIRWRKIGLFLVSLFLFILAITLMKEGAHDLAPLVRDRFAVTNPANSLGFGWLFAYLIMSGSPVAAAALAFFDAGVIDDMSAFTMIAGSRLGGSFIVLFIGFLYVLRGRSRADSLGMGLLSLTITGSAYLAALPLGLGLLYSGILEPVQLPSGGAIHAATDAFITPITFFFLAHLPRWGLFLLGLGIIIVSFSLFDKCLPQMSLKESRVGHISRLVYRPWVMFLLGASITLVSMSVSVSLAILVPLSHRGFVRRENVIPYIMGANVTTFIDTLFAAVVLDDPAAFTIVLSSMVSITLVSLLILTITFHRYEQTMLAFTAWTLRDNRNLAVFMMVILIVPIILMLL